MELVGPAVLLLPGFDLDGDPLDSADGQMLAR